MPMPAASFMVMCCTASRACGPEMRMSPMWLTSKTPTPVRTATCSFIRPPTEGYSTGMSQPLKSTIFAPNWRWTAFNAVLRTGAATWVSADNRESFSALTTQSRKDGVSGDPGGWRAVEVGATKYGNMRDFGWSTEAGRAAAILSRNATHRSRIPGKDLYSYQSTIASRSGTGLSCTASTSLITDHTSLRSAT